MTSEMNRTRTLTIGFSAIALTIIFSHCTLRSGAQVGGAISLKYKFKAGDILKYQTNGSLSVPLPSMGPATGSKAAATKPQTFSLPMNSTQQVKILKVLPMGAATLEITTVGSSASPIGTGGAPTPSKLTLTSSQYGELSNSKGVNTSGSMAGIGAVTGVGALGSISIYLPSKSVRPGDSWSQTVSVPQMSQPGTVNATFVKLSQVGHYKTAHIKLRISIPVSTMVDDHGSITTNKSAARATVSGSVVMVYEDDFAISEGKLVKSAGTGLLNITMRQLGPARPQGGVPAAATPIKATLSVGSTLVQ